MSIDRYDVRLLLDEGAGPSEAEPGQEAEDFSLEELEQERFLDLQLAEPSAEAEQATAVPEGAMEITYTLP